MWYTVIMAYAYWYFVLVSFTHEGTSPDSLTVSGLNAAPLYHHAYVNNVSSWTEK